MPLNECINHERQNFGSGISMRQMLSLQCRPFKYGGTRFFRPVNCNFCHKVTFLVKFTLPIILSINRYRRGLETCPQAKTFKIGREYFLLFFRCVQATSMTQRRVENTRVHFWTFSSVSVKRIFNCKRLSKPITEVRRTLVDKKHY